VWSDPKPHLPQPDESGVGVVGEEQVRVDQQELHGARRLGPDNAVPRRLRRVVPPPGQVLALDPQQLGHAIAAVPELDVFLVENAQFGAVNGGQQACTVGGVLLRTWLMNLEQLIHLVYMDLVTCCLTGQECTGGAALS
jgi:hypothetical protein